MSSPTVHTAHFAPSTPPNRISHLTARLSAQRLESRTPTPTTRIRRQNSHLASSLFPNNGGHMATTLSSLPPDYPGDGCKAGEVFSHEWPICDVKRLQHHLESGLDDLPGPWSTEDDPNDAEVIPEPLRRGIVIAGGWFKLDLVRSVENGQSAQSQVDETENGPHLDSEQLDTLSLYVAALSLDSSSVDITYPASIFVGIKSLTTPTGSRFAETKYHWSTTGEWEFNSIREFWQVQLPKVSDLLDFNDIASQDGFTICVQISTPAPFRPTFSLPGQIKVPRSIVNGLNGLVDSMTGDVKFVCLEHIIQPSEREDHDEQGPKGQRLSRKRVLYAHSEILKASCDYFNDLLMGDFEEAERARRGDSRYTTILVDDAGFETVYWLLKFLYTNELIFATDDDVRVIMDQLRIERQEINRILSVSHFYGSNEWEYRHLYRSGEEPDDIDGIDSRTMKSVSSASTRLSAMSPTPDSLSGTISASGTGRGLSAHNAVSKATTPAVASQASRPARTAQTPISTVPRQRKGPEVQSKRENASSPVTAKSPNPMNRSPYVARVSDPHPHPCPPPPPASALSVFMLSHRYRLETLEQLAKDHILGKMTKQNCMPMLLATYRYDALHAEVLDYIIDNWTSIQPTPEFFQCIQEVSAGVWGETGGMVLHGLFKRL